MCATCYLCRMRGAMPCAQPARALHATYNSFVQLGYPRTIAPREWQHGAQNSTLNARRAAPRHLHAHTISSHFFEGPFQTHSCDALRYVQPDPAAGGRTHDAQPWVSPSGIRLQSAWISMQRHGLPNPKTPAPVDACDGCASFHGRMRTSPQVAGPRRVGHGLCKRTWKGAGVGARADRDGGAGKHRQDEGEDKK